VQENQTARITVTGAGFTSSTTVRVGSATCGDLAVQNAGALLCTVPSTLPPDTYDVIAQNGADVFVFPSGFTVDPAGAPKSSCGCNSSASAASATTSLASAPPEVGLALLALLTALTAPPRARNARRAHVSAAVRE
jgi:hypothetical protein